jgi:cysteine-rich repeat protein
VSTTTSTTGLGVCGDGETTGSETCDDGNVNDNDPCPSDCVIDACTITTTVVPFDVHFTPPPGAVVGGITVLLDHPEGKVQLPGPPIPGGVITSFPTGATGIPVHLGHALRETVFRTGGLLTPAPGRLFRANFRACAEAGGVPPLVGEFDCTVLDAVDNFSNPVSGVTCSVMLP